MMRFVTRCLYYYKWSWWRCVLLYGKFFEDDHYWPCCRYKAFAVN